MSTLTSVSTQKLGSPSGSVSKDPSQLITSGPKQDGGSLTTESDSGEQSPLDLQRDLASMLGFSRLGQSERAVADYLVSKMDEIKVKFDKHTNKEHIASAKAELYRDCYHQTRGHISYASRRLLRDQALWHFGRSQGFQGVPTGWKVSGISYTPHDAVSSRTAHSMRLDGMVY